MLKKNEKLFAIFQQVLDAIFAGLAWYIAYTVRFNIFEGQAGLEMLFLKLSPFIIILTLYFFHKNGLYKSQRFNSRYKEIFIVFKTNTQAILVFVILLYFFSPTRISRMMILGYFLLSQFLLISLRMSVRNFLRMLRRRGINLRHVLLIGHGPQMKEYVETVKSFKDAGIRFIGQMDSGDQHLKLNIPAIDTTLEETLSKYRPDSIVIGYPGDLSHKSEQILKACYNDVIPIQILPDLTYSFVGHQIDVVEHLLDISVRLFQGLEKVIFGGYRFILIIVGGDGNNVIGQTQTVYRGEAVFFPEVAIPYLNCK